MHLSIIILIKILEPLIIKHLIFILPNTVKILKVAPYLWTRILRRVNWIEALQKLLERGLLSVTSNKKP